MAYQVHASCLDDMFQELATGDMLKHDPTDSSNDSHASFSRDCEFLLSTVFNVNTAVSLPTADVTSLDTFKIAAPAALSESHGYEKSIQQQFTSAPSSEARSFGSLFGQPYSNMTGTPADNRSSVPWNPSSLPPKAAKRGSQSDAKMRSSSIKGVTKPKCPAPDKIKPFSLVRAGGMTLQDLNASILEMARHAGMC